MENQPLVSVYIPCRNYGHFLKKSIESVINQLYNNWELFIIDEASTDNTEDVAREFESRLPKKIKFIKNSEPIGLQKIANNILNAASGKYMMRLDADDWLDECALLALVNKIEAVKHVALVYGNYYYTSENGEILGVERRHQLGIEDKAGHLPPHGACTLFRTRALKAVGGYSEDINAQDGWELWYKLFARSGATNVDIPVFYYRQHNTSLSRDQNRLFNARSKIFHKLANSIEGSYKPSCVAVLPIRESYPGFERVPFHKINGITLLERSLLSTSRSDQISKIIISTESQEVLDFAEQLERDGRAPPHLRLLRKKNLTKEGTLNLLEVLLEAGNYYEKASGRAADILLFLSLHAISRTADHLDSALNILRVTEADSIVSVQEERDPLFCHGENGLKLINPGRFHDLAYDRERTYRFNGAILGSWREIISTGKLLGEKISYLEMSAADSAQLSPPTCNLS